MAGCIMPSLETMLMNVQKSRFHKELISRIGPSEKAQVFHTAIERLNSMFNTQFYLERDNRSFIIQGHREYGHVSYTGFVLGNDIDFTLGLYEIEDAGSENTIKMVVDKDNNIIVVSLSTMKDNNELTDENLEKKFYMKKDGTVHYYHWSLDELRQMNALMYTTL